MISVKSPHHARNQNETCYLHNKTATLVRDYHMHNQQQLESFSDIELMRLEELITMNFDASDEDSLRDSLDFLQSIERELGYRGLTESFGLDHSQAA
ncbi:MULTISPECIES: hypothetical protein [unclassified Hahella]|uniref:hypothetical protein n=1 Tax=unclassified Hahella TaxID=2624107 RepID=UPI001C1F1BE4|nr:MULTISPECIES: hypothetical protein [unclassified Hahella]MBU6952501.1 hypothetical protein [Hahella sp. HN01]MDG9671940.1 hypothetical protein [Hahella sp. CR1]